MAKFDFIYVNDQYMIIINTGIPKSGTTLLFDYQKDLISETQGSKALDELKRINNNSRYIQTINDDIYQMLVDIHSNFGSITVKSHEAVNDYFRKLIELHGAKVTCCYRDPRDVILSAMDHSVRSRKGMDKSGAFANIQSVQDGAREMKKWAEIFFTWRDYANVMMIRYEDFIQNKLETLLEMVRFIGLTVDKVAVNRIFTKHEDLMNTKPNFNKATCYRWKSEMTDDDLKFCNDYLSEEILEMGYSIY